MTIDLAIDDLSPALGTTGDVLLLEDPSEPEVVNTIQGHVRASELVRVPEWRFERNAEGLVTSIAFAQVWKRNGEVVRQDVDVYVTEGVQARAEQGSFN